VEQLQARDCQGNFLGCSVLTVVGITYPTVLESLACREALTLASDPNVGGLKIATDCLEVDDSLQSMARDGGRYGYIVKKCIDAGIMSLRLKKVERVCWFV
jgi:hypothetical protein